MLKNDEAATVYENFEEFKRKEEQNQDQLRTSKRGEGGKAPHSHIRSREEKPKKDYADRCRERKSY